MGDGTLEKIRLAQQGMPRQQLCCCGSIIPSCTSI